VKKIARYEGASSLWRGLSPTLVMSIPATVIYFVGYDYLKDVLSEKLNPIHKTPSSLATTHPLLNGTFVYEYRETLAPLLAGGFARTVAATVISPLELFRTRMQSVHTDTKGNAGLFRGVAQGIVAMVRSEGVLSLWRGLTPTLWRDVPFSAIYWVGYENIKKTITTWDKNKHTKPVLNEFEIAFTSGAISGMIAATLTTPFDVAKTRRQVDMMQPVHTKIMSLMRAIAREEGYRGLWRGLTARVAKIAPSCAIMISSYEIGKKALS
ncbi:MAG: mitochondrial carrier domain-containing protein, partial [Benniella sp.]